ncbi:MAG: Ldh family oxidoreductase [Alphaproteobacteria bacterium]|nr:Ldh family oxidoreductase [Alphaproteobacteria bacterium]
MTVTERPSRILDAGTLRRFAADLLVAAGCSREDAVASAEVFVEADLRGFAGQGVDYLPYMVHYLQGGKIDPKGKPEILRDLPAAVLIDGHKGPGHAAAFLACDIAAKKAKAAGCATVALANSADIYMIGYYAERLARAGVVGMVATSGPPLVHPPGGMERVLSTNPIAFAFPLDGPDPFVVDMAMSTMSRSHVRLAAYHKEQVPPGTGIGPDGHSSTDAVTVMAGALSTLAGHKGFGLALSVALLCGPLTTSEAGPALAGWQDEGKVGRHGHLFVAIDPAAFGSLDEFRAAARAHIAEIKNSKTAPGAAGIRIPGERGFAERAERLKSGVPVLDATWAALGKIAEELKVKMPV